MKNGRITAEDYRKAKEKIARAEPLKQRVSDWEEAIGKLGERPDQTIIAVRKDEDGEWIGEFKGK